MPSIALMIAAARSAESGRDDQAIELGFRAQEDSALLAEILLGQRADLAAPGGQAHLDLRFDRQVAAVGMAEEDQAHHGHEVLVAGQAGIGAQEVGGAPQAPLDSFDVLELAHWYLRAPKNDYPCALKTNQGMDRGNPAPGLVAV